DRSEHFHQPCGDASHRGRQHRHVRRLPAAGQVPGQGQAAAGDRQRLHRRRLGAGRALPRRLLRERQPALRARLL
ncbi:MAG: hypothetical protein AVDCRST_MAG10-105, partial [uncultured Acidimicrobiales bacterium]